MTPCDFHLKLGGMFRGGSAAEVRRLHWEVDKTRFEKKLFCSFSRGRNKVIVWRGTGR